MPKKNARGIGPRATVIERARGTGPRATVTLRLLLLLDFTERSQHPI